MLDHPIVDVALGLILLYSTLSLVASVVKEWISSVLGLRAKNLQKGIQTLIGEDHAARLYGHPLVSTLAKEKKLPSYIGSGTFASVVVDLLAHDENGKSLVAARDKAAVLVDRVGDDPVLGPALRALGNAGAETVADLRREIADWFDEGMNRVSGMVSAEGARVHLRDRCRRGDLRQREHRPRRPGPLGRTMRCAIRWPSRRWRLLAMRRVQARSKCRMTFSRRFRWDGKVYRVGVWGAGSRICSGGCSRPRPCRSGRRSGSIC